MSKKLLNWMLLAAMVLSLGISVTACKDDDNDTGNEQKKDDVDPLDTEDARVAWRWLCQLTDAETLDNNWKSKQYEPTVGEASENNQFARIIVVSDLDEAKVLFSKLADLSPTQLSTKQTVNGGAAGTMTWEPSKAGADNLAVVEVNSKIMPHLQKIIYCTQEQTGQNGFMGLGTYMKGTPYYRLGDVVRDKDGYYWICVRPAFTPEDKQDSHWINVFNATAPGYVFGTKHPIPEANIKNNWNKIPKYNNKTILLPTKLTYDREHIFNLSQLLWAMLYPETYKEAYLYDSNSGLCGFDYIYHGEKFLSTVATHWDEKVDGVGYNLWQILFGCTLDQMKNLTKMGFFYQGYKWWAGSTADMWIFTSNSYIRGGYSGSESDDKEDIDVVTHGFDINRYSGDEKADTSATGGPVARKFLGTERLLEGNWVVRYKKGKDLYSGAGKYSPHTKLEGCVDIYVYNLKENLPYGPDVAQDDESLRQGFSGVPYYRIGDVFTDQHNGRWCVLEGAGNEYNTRDVNSEYSYLISFDNIETTPDGSRATNLPSKDMVIKAMLWLDLIAAQTADRSDDGLRTSTSPLKMVGWSFINDFQVDLRKIFDYVLPRDGGGADESTHITCVAYRSDDGQQRILRFLNECESVTSIRMNRYYFWEHYRDFASETSPYYQRYTNDIVYLSDISNEQKVRTYGSTDPYALQPFSLRADAGRGSRTARTQTDARSNDVRNYFYANRQFVSDARSMWNEPVLFFRIIKVRDKGENDHSNQSVDGNITLTRIHQVNWMEDEDEDVYCSVNGFERQWGMSMTQSLKDIYLDGKNYILPTWKNLE